MIKDGVRNSNSIGRAAEEFAGAQLGDERRTKRLFKIAAAVERDPAISFPKAMRSDAELEAFYANCSIGSKLEVPLGHDVNRGTNGRKYFDGCDVTLRGNSHTPGPEPHWTTREDLDDAKHRSYPEDAKEFRC